MKRLIKNVTVMAIAFMLTNSFALGAAGDIDNDGDTDLKDVIMSLQVNVGLTPAGVTTGGDVNNDGKIGLQEAIYILQFAAQLRMSGPGSCLSAEENALANLINNYRNANGLSSVPISKSLTAVAQWHVWDLQTNNPVTATCNLHSWSAQKPDLWTTVCYLSNTSDLTETQKQEMWKKMWIKPQEISNGVYTAYGYENSAYSSAQATALDVFNQWKDSTMGHKDLILQQGIFANYQWKAMGVGIYEKYAVVWFGDITDPQGTITQCQ